MLYRSFVSLLLLFCLCSTSAAQTGGQNVAASGGNRLLIVELDRISSELRSLSQELNSMDSEHGQRVELLESKVSEIAQRQTDALMDISNAVSVADTTLGAANTAIENAESHLTYSTVILTLLAIVAAVIVGFAQIKANNTDARVVRKLVVKLKEHQNSNGVSIVDEIKSELKEDLFEDASESARLAVNSEQFTGTLRRLVEEAVKAESQGGKTSKQPLSFQKP